MAILPSGYIPRNMLGGSNIYFDTGVTPANTLNTIGLFFVKAGSTNNATWVFGARNSNSTSSVGQTNFVTYGMGNTARIGWQSAQLSVQNYTGGYAQFKNIGNEIELADGSTHIVDLTGNASAFTGNRNIYLLALNNAGIVTYGSGADEISVCEFSISQNSVELLHYIPVYDEANAVFGLYDLVSGTIVQHLGTGSYKQAFLLEVQSTTGGQAYIVNDTIQGMSKKYIQRYSLGRERLVATPETGYEFLNWTDSNGNVLSRDRYFDFTSESSVYIIDQDTVVTANFQKKTNILTKNRYQLLGLQYGVGYISNSSSPDGKDSDIYASVISFDCNEDMLSSSTSTIVLNEVPDLYQVGIPVFLFSPMGKMVWCGVIESINGTTLNCREPISVADVEMVFDTLSTTQAYKSVNSGIRDYVFNPMLDGYLDTNRSQRNISRLKKNSPFSAGLHQNYLVYEYDTRIVFGQTMYTMPQTDKGLKNVESFLFDMATQYGNVFEAQLYEQTNTSYPAKGIKHLMFFYSANPLKYTLMHIGTNSEAISNVSIEMEDKFKCANSLTIYNSSGSSARGMFGVKTDGSVDTMPSLLSGLTSDFLASTNCINVTVMSDDSIKQLIRENLGNATLNHKITFDVDLTGMYFLDDFKLGRRVDFYDGGRVFNSIITGVSFSGETDEVKKATITLGNVRTKLTKLINMARGK